MSQENKIETKIMFNAELLNKKILLCATLLSASLQTNCMQPRMRMLQLARSTRQFSTSGPEKRQIYIERAEKISVCVGAIVGGYIGTIAVLGHKDYSNEPAMGAMIAQGGMAIGAVAGGVGGFFAFRLAPVLLPTAAVLAACWPKERESVEYKKE